MEPVLCRACLSSIPLSQEREAIGSGHWYTCPICATLNWFPLPNDDVLSMHYARAYAEGGSQVPDFVRDRLHDIVDGVVAGVFPNNRVLDVGFGEGFLLEQFAIRGWACVGTELSEASLALGEARNWEVHLGSQWLEAAIAPVSVVGVYEVLEHLPDPAQTLHRVRQLLLPGGLLIGTTPNAGSLNRRILHEKWSIMSPPEHLTIFSKGGLCALLERTGFRPDVVKSQGLYPGEVFGSIRDWVNRNRGTDPEGVQLDRVAGSYQLNEALVTRPVGRRIKSIANRLLAATDLGDTLGFSAS